MRCGRRWRCTARVGRSLPTVTALASVLCFVGGAPAQSGDAEIEGAAAAVAASVSGAMCSIHIRGTPRFDGFTSTWLVAYMAHGAGCDDAGAELTRLGKDKSLVFFRRPDADQARALIASIRASVAWSFHCPISLRGEPRFDEETGYWLVSFVASGPGCGDAAIELARLGADYQIQFQSSMQRQELVP